MESPGILGNPTGTPGNSGSAVGRTQGCPIGVPVGMADGVAVPVAGVDGVWRLGEPVDAVGGTRVGSVVGVRASEGVPASEGCIVSEAGTEAGDSTVPFASGDATVSARRRCAVPAGVASSLAFRRCTTNKPPSTSPVSPAAIARIPTIERSFGGRAPLIPIGVTPIERILTLLDLTTRQLVIFVSS